MNIEQLTKILKEEYNQTKGTYNKAIIFYSLELAENIGDHYTTTQEERDNLDKISKEKLKELALNGASDWGAYSWGGCSLCYNGDILKTLFCPSIAKRYENGDTVRGLHLLDHQARAISRAFSHILHTIKRGF